jgi:hypothetical protein
LEWKLLGLITVDNTRDIAQNSVRLDSGGGKGEVRNDFAATNRGIGRLAPVDFEVQEAARDLDVVGDVFVLVGDLSDFVVRSREAGGESCAGELEGCGAGVLLGESQRGRREEGDENRRGQHSDTGYMKCRCGLK